MTRRLTVFIFGLCACAGAASAQTRAGGEFLVNTVTTGKQYYSAVGRDARGNFVVVWMSDATAIEGQRYDRAGRRMGGEFTVSPPGGYVQFPGVAMNARGEFLVAWSRDGGGAAAQDIYAQLFDATGARVGADFQVNLYTTATQTAPGVAADGRGNFVVVWWSAYQDGSGFGMAGRPVSRQGTLLGSEFVANTYTTGLQYLGDVAAGPNGDFVVAWSSYPADQGDGFSVNAQRFDAAGTRLGDSFQVNTYTTGGTVEAAPGVAMAPDGSFVIAFVSTRSNGGDIYAQRYTPAGDRIGGEFLVNTYTTGIQIHAHVAADSAGNFTVVWDDFSADGSSGGVRGRRFRADGTPRSDDFAVNTYTTGTQLANKVAASVAGDPAGNVVVTWYSDVGQGSLVDAFGQRYGGLHPLALTVDDTGNNVWEPGETALMEPLWFNDSGVSQAPGGGLADLTGPAGATYTIADGAGAYPPLADGSGSTCTDCYSVSVSAPATRPVTHWDAAVTETLTPDAEGQANRWLLHIGHSFADVADDTAYYRFVETLLHESITAGCTATAYCPASSTAREQMAVFVLVAKEEAAFRPPSCTTPLFSDVPASSPFCPFIEELARRGVVNGCGNGRFCPGDAVTREQMAVFALRTLDPVLIPPPCTTPVFTDVPGTSPYCRWIEELARRHVVAGCGGGRYCPADAVTREQMAVFISATFGLSLYGV